MQLSHRLRPFFGVRPWTRHGLVLAVAGHVYILVGLAYVLTSGTPNATRESALRLALATASLQVWGAVFMAAGALALLSSRWPPASETWGYTTLTGLSSLWAGFYFAGICLGASPQGASGVLVWGLMAFMWWAISGLVNPADTEK
jgi:hypothetical protein